MTKKVASERRGHPAEKSRSVKKIVFVTGEAVPFAHTGGLGEVASSLPKALNQLDGGKRIECRVVMPLYKSVSQEYRSAMKFLGSAYVTVSWRRQYMGVFSLEKDNVMYYFIDNEYYFGRSRMYGHYDDCERYTFFSKAVFESIALTGFEPDVIHANDWQTALVPVYQHLVYRRAFVKTVFTVHNIEYQGSYTPMVLGDIIDIPTEDAKIIKWGDSVNLLKGGIEACNRFTTVSPSYAEELKHPANAFGLDEIVRRNSHKMQGILNGIDTDSYNPMTDDALEKNFSANSLKNKGSCKEALQKELGLAQSSDPLLAMITRLVPAKGMDLVTATIDSILDTMDCQLVLLGTGDAVYEDFFKGVEQRHSGKAVCIIDFDSRLSRKIYSAADIFLMPSRSEACGLAQMISCRYGTVPLVREVGGLKDSIEDCTLGQGSGFLFRDFSADAFYNTVSGAVERFANKKDWEKLVCHDMAIDFGWSKAAGVYASMYESL